MDNVKKTHEEKIENKASNKYGLFDTSLMQEQTKLGSRTHSIKSGNLWKGTILNQRYPNNRDFPYVSGSCFEILVESLIKTWDDYQKILEEVLETFDPNQGNTLDDEETVMGVNQHDLETFMEMSQKSQINLLSKTLIQP